MMNRTIDEKQVLKNLMAHANFRKAFRDLMLEDTYLAEELGVGDTTEEIIYLWCVEMKNLNDDKKYYHPIVTFDRENIDLDLTLQSYDILYSDNQFEAHMYNPYVDYINNYVGMNTRVIVVPKSMFERLKLSLKKVVDSIICEVRQCFENIDKIAKLTCKDGYELKKQFLESIFGGVTLTSSCLNQRMEIIDSADHEYKKEAWYGFDEELEEDVDGEYEEVEDEKVHNVRSFYRVFYRRENEKEYKYGHAWLLPEEVEIIMAKSWDFAIELLEKNCVSNYEICCLKLIEVDNDMECPF